jgi:hypothetical protein
MTVPVLRWPDLIPEDGAAYALSLRRDRVLIVGGESLDEGWHQASQQAVSDVSGCWRVFDLPGPRAFAILERGGEVSVDVPSSSAVRFLFGFEVLLSLRPEQGCRIHVPTAQAVALIQHVSHLVSVI